MKPSLYKINIANNDRYELYGISKDTFFKMFLKCHDRNDNRQDFMLDLASSILIHHNQDPASVVLATYNGLYRDPDEYLWTKPVYEYDMQKGYTCYKFKSWITYRDAEYHSLRKRCAKHFGVSSKSLPSISMQSKAQEIMRQAELRKYFETRHVVKEPLDCDYCIN